jgi:biotin carboxyl carrier protein
MEHELVAHAAGVAAEVWFEAGQRVDADAAPIAVEPET